MHTHTELVIFHFRAALRELFTDTDMELFFYCEELLSALSQTNTTNLNFNCHSICRAISTILPRLSVVTGGLVGYTPDPKESDTLIIKISSHSWLTTPDGAIIDPNPVGCIACSPLMFPAMKTGSAYTAFGSQAYNPTYKRHGFRRTKKVRSEIEALINFWKKRLPAA